MRKTIIYMTVLIFINKIFAIFREIILASIWGTSYIVDAYLTAGAIGGIVFGWLLSVHFCFTPVYVNICNNKSDKDGRIFTGNIISFMLIVYILLAIVLYFGRGYFVELIVPGYIDESKKQTISFLAISAFSIVIVPVVNVLKAYLDANQYFIQSMSTDSIFSIFQIGMIVASGVVGVRFLGYSLIVPFVIQLMFLIVILYTNGLKFPLKFQITGEVKKIIILLFPISVSSILTEINSFVDKLFASMLETGSVSVLNYAVTLREAILNIFMYAFITISFPLMSNYISQGKIDKLKINIQSSLKVIICLFLPLSVGAIVLSNNIITILYGRGNFTLKDINETSSVFVIYLLAVIPIALRTYFLKLLYAFQDTGISVKIGIVSTLTNIVFNCIFIQYWGREGLALATTCSDYLTLPLMLHFTKIRIGKFWDKEISMKFIKALISSLLMGLVIVLVKHTLLREFSFFNTLICTIVGGLVYYAISFFIKLEEVKEFFKYLKNTD